MTGLPFLPCSQYVVQTVQTTNTCMLSLKVSHYVSWIRTASKRMFNPLPHGGRTYWPITSLHANFSKSSEGKVSSKIRYSSSWILGLFWNHKSTYLGLNYPVFNFFVKLSKIGGLGWPPPWCHSLLINRYNIVNSLTAEASLVQQIWPGRAPIAMGRRGVRKMLQHGW